MIHHVAVLLDADHASVVRGIWDDLQLHHGLAGVKRVPIPHISLYAVEGPPDCAGHEPLAALARRTAPFQIHAHGFVVFAGDDPGDLCLGVLVARSARLSRLQDGVHSACMPAGTTVADPLSGQFAHDVWTPHITLADRDLTPAALAKVFERLAARPHPSWSITVDNLACLSTGPRGVDVSWRQALVGEEDPVGT